DKNGSPNLAYYDTRGGMHEAHSTGGKAWAVSDLAAAPLTYGPGPISPSTGWSTDFAVSDKGVHYVTWAGLTPNQVTVATDQSGQFKSLPVPSSVGGANPSIAVSADAKKQAIA